MMFQTEWKKNLQVVDQVLNNTASGLSQSIMATLTKQSNKDDVVDGSNNKMLLMDLMTKHSYFCWCVGNEKAVVNIWSLNQWKYFQVRKRANFGLAGIPTESSKYHCSRISESEINLFLDFFQFGGWWKTLQVEHIQLSSKKKVVIPNALRTVHPAEIIRLYKAACDQMNQTKVAGWPSTRPLWTILQSCPASQLKCLLRLDNIAAKGVDAFDCIISRMKFI